MFLTYSGFGQSYFYSLGVGGNLFKGDVQQWNVRPSWGQIKTTMPSLVGSFGVQVNKTFDFRAQLNVGYIKGDASLLPSPAVPLTSFYSPPQFSSPLVQLSVLADYNFFDFKSNEETWFSWTPYFVGGIGSFYANSRYGNLDPKPLISFSIPYGVGVKWKLNKHMMLRFEALANKLTTDKLDWVSEHEVSYNDAITGDPKTKMVLDITGTKSSAFKLNNTDQYFNFSVSVIYSIYPIICPSGY